MMNIDTDLLRTLLVFLTERSVSRAAVRMQVSQPAASHALNRLRQYFNDPLLVRARGGMAPTERAVQIGKELTAVLHRLDSLGAVSVPFDPAQSRRMFSFTTGDYAELVIGPTLLGQVSAASRTVQMDFRRPDPARVNDLLETGQLDFRMAWVRGNPVPSSMRSKTLFEDRFVCIARASHPTIDGRITLQKFLAMPQACVRYAEGVTLTRIVDEAIRKIPADLPAGMQVRNYVTLPFFVATSDFIATVPLRLARAFQAALPIQIFDAPLRLPRIRFAVYWHERSQKDPGHRWMRQRLEDAAAVLASDSI